MSATERLLARREDLKRDEAVQVSIRDLFATPWGIFLGVLGFTLLALAAALGWS
jgi:hypothetical protein